jgi:S1-C subfamily serine protease
MPLMIRIRGPLFAVLLCVLSPAPAAQEVGLLRVRIVISDGTSSSTIPVARHVLLVSQNPTSAPPRVMVTAADGTAQLRLGPGNYTVESEKPAVFEGKGYEWMQIVEVAAGRDTVLDLTRDNAEVTALGGTPASDASFLMSPWQDTVVALWTPTRHASGFVVDAKGLIATNHRAVGGAASVEVEVSPTVKVAATVLLADASRDVAFLWVNPEVVSAVRPLPLSCGQAAQGSVADGEAVVTISAPLGQPKRMSHGKVNGVDSRRLVSDLPLTRGSSGGPVFAARGELIGFTSTIDDSDQDDTGTSRIVRREFACEVFEAARQKMTGASPPSAALLPREPTRPFPVAALQEAAARRSGNLHPYRVSSPDTFDVAFITPVLIYGAKHEAKQPLVRGNNPMRALDAEQARVRTLTDFSNWSSYLEEHPPVVLVRVTPKLVEGFWTTIGRVAARTQGVAIPPIKRFTSGFSRLRAFCGEAEVTPIHPFKLEQRVSDTEAIHEGLYVFDPGSFGPHCKTVKLVMYSEKDPQKAYTRVVEAAVVQQVWEDFAAYR